MSRPLWGDMPAAERLAVSVAYLQYNYGSGHPFTVAAEAGDLAAFRKAAAHVTEMMDARIVGILEGADPRPSA